jgi:cell division protein FtsB
MNKLIRLPWVRVIIIITSIIISIGLVRSIISLWQKKDMVVDRQRVLEYAQQEHTELENKLQDATSSAYVEELARNKLGLVKEGETVVLMDKRAFELLQKSQDTVSEQLPNWKRWLKLFF